MTPLSQEEFVAGIGVLAASLARYRMHPEEQHALGEAWLRVVYPKVKSREHWDRVVDLLLTTCDTFPRPGDVIAILGRAAWDMYGHGPIVTRGPLWPGGEDQEARVIGWVNANPPKLGEGTLEYIDRIAFENGLIPERLVGPSPATSGLETTAPILARLRGEEQEAAAPEQAVAGP